MADLEIISQPPELPPEILFFHILPRLPTESVFRFHCVRKQWRSFLKTPTFSDLHRRHHNRHKILFMSTKPPYTFRTMDCETPEDDFLSAARSLPFEAKLQDVEMILFLASFNGLLCVGIDSDTYDQSGIEQYSDLIIWNPLTGEYKTLSRTNSVKECFMCWGMAFGLYYNCSEDDYKLLRVTYDYDVYIYSLKSDSWIKIDDHNIQRIPYGFLEYWERSVVSNEKLYFLKQVMMEVSLRMRERSYSIITFDMKTEKFSEIATPSFENRSTLWLHIVVVRERIHLFGGYTTTNGNRVIEMWRMDGKEDWKKVTTYIDQMPSFPWFPWFRFPLHVMNNGNWIMYSKEKGYVYKVDLEKHTKQDLFSFTDMGIRYLGKYID